VPRSHSYLESDQFFKRNTHTSNGIEYQSFKQPDPPFIDDSITAFHISAIQLYNRSPMTKPTVPILIHRGKGHHNSKYDYVDIVLPRDQEEARFAKANNMVVR